MLAKSASEGLVIAFVASTLPIALLDKRLIEWDVDEIVLQGPAHLASYRYLKARHPFLSLRVLPQNFFLNFLMLSWILAKLRLTRGRVFFFHECCCPVFDILVKIFQPQGAHYPQVTLGGFEKVDEDLVFPARLHRLICFFGLKNLFDYYRGDNENKEGYFFVQAIKDYPKSIERHQVLDSRQFLFKFASQRRYYPDTRKIIILCGRDIVEDKSLAKIYAEIIDLASSFGFTCYLKDHPSRIARLNMRHELAQFIDPSMPLELVDDDFIFAIGVASTGMLHFGMRAISIIRLLPDCHDGESRRRISHLLSMPGGQAVQFPEDLSALKEIFLKTTIASNRNSN